MTQGHPENPDAGAAPLVDDEAMAIQPTRTGGPSPPSLAGAKAPGFWQGFTSMFGGMAFVVTRPASWPFALVPVAVLAVLVTLGAWLSIGVIQPWAARALSPDSGSWFAQAGASLGSWLLTTVALLGSVLLSLALAPPLSGPALEQIVSQREHADGVPARAPIGFLMEIWCGAKAQVMAACMVVPLLALLWVIGALFPPAAFVTTPLSFLITGFGLAWNLFDYPLTLRGVKIRRRFGLVWRHKAATAGFGLSFALLFWLPCFNILLLPVGVAAATQLIWKLIAWDPLGTDLLGVSLEAQQPAAAPTADAS